MARYKEYGYDIKDGVGIITKWEMETKEGEFTCCEEIQRITVPKWARKIGDCVFSGFPSHAHISIPPSVRKMRNRVFCRCSLLTSISIPSSVTEIGEVALIDCTHLKNIAVSKANKFYDSREDCNAIIHTKSNTLVRGCENTSIPSSVTAIGEWPSVVAPILQAFLSPHWLVRLAAVLFLVAPILQAFLSPHWLIRLAAVLFLVAPVSRASIFRHQ